MVKNINRPGNEREFSCPVPPDRRITVPSFHYPDEPQRPFESGDIERVSVQTVAQISKNQSSAPPSPTSYSLINPENGPETDLHNLIIASRKLHSYLHKGLNKLDSQGKKEAKEILREIMRYLDQG